MCDEDFEKHPRENRRFATIDPGMYDMQMAKALSISSLAAKKVKPVKLSDHNMCKVLPPDDALGEIARRATDLILNWNSSESCSIQCTECVPLAYNEKSIWTMSKSETPSRRDAIYFPHT
jgi:hypothetical protein